MAINFKDFGNKLRNADTRLKLAIAENSFKPSDSREEFFSQNTFSIGASVLVEGIPHEIIDKRSNYVVVINECGVYQKQFHTNLEKTDLELSYSSGTFKGVYIPPGLDTVIEDQTITDPYGLIRLFEQYKTKNYLRVFESAGKVGLDILGLTEQVDEDHRTAIDIVADQLDIKLTSADTKGRYLELKKKLGDLKISPENHEIYHHMIQTLHLLGLDHLYDNGRSLPVGQHTGPKHTEIGHSLGGGELNQSARKMRIRKLLNN